MIDSKHLRLISGPLNFYVISFTLFYLILKHLNIVSLFDSRKSSAGVKSSVKRKLVGPQATSTPTPKRSKSALREEGIHDPVTLSGLHSGATLI